MKTTEVSGTLFWPRKQPPPLEEASFAFQFCRRFSRKEYRAAMPGCSWVDYADENELLAQVSTCRSELLLVVRDPTLLLCRVAVRSLTEAILGGKKACGPVYNQSKNPAQIARMPVPYINMATYLEIADLMANGRDRQLVPADRLDAACVLYAQGVFGRSETKAFVIDTGALVHSFGDLYESERVDLVELVPESVHTVLDIGCAMGGYGKSLKKRRPDIRITGVEINPFMAERANRHYDGIVTESIKSVTFDSPFDLINCGDVLEHLRDPWELLEKFSGLLKEGGYLVLSVPNIGHWSVVRDMLQGRFQYVPAGLLCITHIRWFTEESICEALEDAGFSVEVFEREQIQPTPQGEAFIREMRENGYGNEESLRTNEFIIRARRR